MGPTRRDALLLAIPICTIFVMLENHYIRDTVGALEKQMETDLGMKPEEYSTLNSLYFMPNIVAPLFIGVFCELSGRPSMFFLITAVALAVGNIVFSCGAHFNSLSMFYSGRFITGCVYEIIDTIPIIILGPLFRSNWGLMVGIMNGMLRFGTVLTFAVSPIVYSNYGVEAALWVSSLMGVLGIIAAIAAYFADVWLENCDREEEERELIEDAGASYELPLQQPHYGTRDTPMEVRSGTDAPTRKSFEYYQALQTQLDGDPLADTLSAPAQTTGKSSGTMRTIESTRNTQQQDDATVASPPDRSRQQGGTGRSRSRSPSHGHGSPSTRPPEYDDPLSPMGTRFTGRNASLLKAEASAVISNRRRIISEDAADSYSAGPYLGSNSANSGEFDGSVKYLLSSQSEERTPLVGLETSTRRVGSSERGGLSGAPEKGSTFTLQAIGEWLLAISPFQDYGAQYYFYLLNSVCLFGAVVPFWFTGAKFLQLNYGMTVENADFLMLLPEGAMMVISPILGFVLDCLRLSLRSKLILMGAVCFGAGVSFVGLAYGYPESGSGWSLSPLVTILTLSCCYACANSLTWDVVIQVVPNPDQLAPATGLSAAGCNLLPSLVPYVIVLLTRHYGSAHSGAHSSDSGSGGGSGGDGSDGSGVESNIGMLVLAAVAALAGVSALCAALCEARTYDADILEGTGLLLNDMHVHGGGSGGAGSGKSGRGGKDSKDRYSYGSEYDII